MISFSELLLLIVVAFSLVVALSSIGGSIFSCWSVWFLFFFSSRRMLDSIVILMSHNPLLSSLYDPLLCWFVSVSGRHGALERRAVPSLPSLDPDPREMNEDDKVLSKESLLAYFIVSYNQSVKGWVRREQPISMRICDWLPWTDCASLAARHEKVMRVAVRAQSARQPFARATR